MDGLWETGGRLLTPVSMGDMWLVVVDMTYYPYVSAFDDQATAKAIYDRTVADWDMSAATVYLVEVLENQDVKGYD